MLESIKEKILSVFADGQRASGENRDIHLGEPGFLRQLVRRKELEGVFLFLTKQCNSRCRTCFYTRDTMEGDDLTLDEIRRLSDTAPGFDKLWLSGGEPFLRKDLPEIIELFYRQNGIKVINLPTNALLAEPVLEGVQRMLDSCPKMTIHLNFSFDGMGEAHDRVRGVPGSFAKTLATIERVEDHFGDNPRLIRNVATVVTGETSLPEIYDLAAFLFARFKLATQFFETVRGDTRDSGLARPTRAQLAELHRQLVPLYDAMADRLFAKLPIGARQLAKLYFMGILGHLYRLQEQNVEGPHPWGMDCTAGKTTFVIDHDGGFRACEMRPRIGHLRDYGFDLGAAVRSAAMRQEIEAIGGGHRAGCWCTHTCWMLSSLKFSPRTLLYEVPRAYLASRGTQLPPLVASAIDTAELARRHGVGSA